MKNRQKKKRPFKLIIFLFLTTFLTFKTFKKVDLKDIKIYGSSFFSKEDIVANSSLNLPTPLLFVKTKYTEEELKKNLSLKNVLVFRQILPFGLKIQIKTRTPIASAERIFDGKKISGFIDEDGFFIDEKNLDKQKLKKLSTKILGWNKNHIEISSKILNFQKKNNVEFFIINFSQNGFLTLEEKNLKTILLGFNQKGIETQLQIISDLKNQLNRNKLLEAIDNIDLTDPSNPKIKVFKP